MVVPATNLITWRKISCGCLESAVKHGHAAGGIISRTYKSWYGMKTRCYNPRQRQYKDYGGRGIKVCDRWLHSFENFLEDMGERPPGTTLERMDNDGDYCPENCKRATRVEQGNNTRTNKWITYEGETLTLHQWSTRLGINPGTLYSRLRSPGWSVEKAFTKPIGRWGHDK